MRVFTKTEEDYFTRMSRDRKNPIGGNFTITHQGTGRIAVLKWNANPEEVDKAMKRISTPLIKKIETALHRGRE